MTNVLVVEDNQPARAVLAMALSNMGLAVSEAARGEEALATAILAGPHAKIERPVHRSLYTAKELQTARD